MLEKSTGLLPFKFSRIGKWWYKDKEIDLIVLNDETKEILFIECKWKRLDYRSVIKIIKSLKEKSKSFEWNNDKRKEYFGIVSREIRNKEQLLKDGFIVFDMDDF